MWLFTKHGFYSIVQKAPSEWHVRARVRGDLDNLLTAANLESKIIDTRAGDYQWRIILRKKCDLMAVAGAVFAIDYENFKDMIADTPDQKGKLQAYHTIWSLMAHASHR